MLSRLLLIAGALVTLIGGIAHLFLTKAVVRGFGDIIQGNKYIITMEWVVEGAAIIYMGALLAGVTLIDKNCPVSFYVYIISIILLLILAIIYLFSRFKVKFFPFKLSPIIFTLSAILIIMELPL